MPTQSGMNRREYLVRSGVASAGVIGLAGCIGGGGGDGGDGGDGGGDGSDGGSGDGGDGMSETYEFTLASGSEGSSPYGAGQALLSLVHDEADNIDLTVQTSAGTAGNIRLIAQEEVNAAILNNYTLDQAYNDEGIFVDEPVDTLGLAGFTEGFSEGYFFATDDSGIETYEDMRGMNVWPFWPGGSFRNIVQKLWTEQLDFWDDINVVNAGPTEMPGLVAEGRIDVFGAFSSSGKGIVGMNQELDARDNLSFHPISMSDANWSQISDIEIPNMNKGPVYGWSRDFEGTEVVRMTAQNTVGFHPDVSTDAAYALTKLAHEYGQRLSEDSTHFPDITKAENLTRANVTPLPIHPGVAKYYKEIDVWNDEWSTPS